MLCHALHKLHLKRMVLPLRKRTLNHILFAFLVAVLLVILEVMLKRENRIYLFAEKLNAAAAEYATGGKRSSFFRGYTPVHVVFTCDAKSLSQRRLLAAAVNSVATNIREPERLVIHVFVEVEFVRSVLGLLNCVLPGSKSRLNVHGTDFQVDLPINVRHPGKAEIRLLNPANYIRFLLADLLESDVTKVLYLDTDVIVLDDISKMYDNHLIDPTSRVLAAAKRGKHVSLYANFSERAVLESGILPNTTAFNAGVILIRLDNWRAQDITRKVRYWMQLNEQHQIYELGSQPPLLLSIGDDYERIDASWNVDGAGFKKLDSQLVSEAKILHWTGATKGDMPEAFHREVWLEYDSSQCFSL